MAVRFSSTKAATELLLKCLATTSLQQDLLPDYQLPKTLSGLKRVLDETPELHRLWDALPRIASLNPTPTKEFESLVQRASDDPLKLIQPSAGPIRSAEATVAHAVAHLSAATRLLSPFGSPQPPNRQRNDSQLLWHRDVDRLIELLEGVGNRALAQHKRLSRERRRGVLIWRELVAALGAPPRGTKQARGRAVVLIRKSLDARRVVSQSRSTLDSHARQLLRDVKSHDGALFV